MSGPYKKILILVAMAHEAAPVISALSLAPSSSLNLNGPMKAFEGKHGQSHVFLVINGARPIYDYDGKPRLASDGTPVQVEGVSVVSASIATWEAIRVVQPDLVLNVGTAGGRREGGAKRGEVYLCNGPIKYFDRHVDFRAPGDNFEPNNYLCFGLGSFPTLSLPDELRVKLNLPLGIVATAASFGAGFGKNQEVFEKTGAFLVEMEAAAIAGSTFIQSGVTDYIDGGAASGEEFNEHLAPVSETIAQRTRALVTALCAK